MGLKLPFEIKDVKPGEFLYLTKRKLEDKDGNEKGEILLWKRSGIIVCPECGEKSYTSKVAKKKKCPECKAKLKMDEVEYVKKEGEESEYVMKCPYCEKEQGGEILLVKRPYRVKCDKCGRTTTLPKLKDTVKK